jgi:hypothetical protein
MKNVKNNKNLVVNDNLEDVGLVYMFNGAVAGFCVILIIYTLVAFNVFSV